MPNARGALCAVMLAVVIPASALALSQPASAADYPPVPPQVELPPGGSALEVNGVKTPVIVAPTPQGTGLAIQGPGFTMALQGQTSGGSSLPVAPDGSLLLDQNGQAAVGGTGFQPQTGVGVYLFSTPYFLGTAPVKSDGSFEADFPMPPGIGPGKHTIQASGYSKDGAARVLNVSVTVQPSLVRKKQTVVLFGVLSPDVTAAGDVDLKALVRSVPATALDVTVSVVGYVQPTVSTNNDAALSLQRASNTASELKALGLTGKYTVKGNGRATQAGALARRVVVTVSYTSV